MVFTCKICKNRSNLAMFGFPSKPSALNNWRIAAKIPVDTKTSNFKLCFRHFESNNIEAVIKIEYSLKNKGKKCVIYKVSQPVSEIHQICQKCQQYFIVQCFCVRIFLIETNFVLFWC